MASLNRAQLIGRLGKDPEITRTNGGLMVAKFSIATSESWRDKQSGEKKERTEWHNIVCFNENLSKIIEQYLKKGSEVFVEGQIQTRSWEKDGVKKYTAEIILQGFDCKIQMLGGKSDGGGGGRDYDREAQDRGRGSSSAGASSGRASSHLDDEIPF